ncbi:transketolase [Cellulomonas fimi]|uniref:transketolase n=1 Tax=Cellulomonas fimi TaxID=1708 RepID=UPI00235889D4|nr:transketolase [Cellulomonas fimi]
MTGRTSAVEAGVDDRATWTPVDDLEARAAQLRTLVLEMVWCAGSGHPGASFSAADIVAALYFDVLRHRPDDPRWAGRDRFLLSKGHAVPVVYAALAASGYFPLDELRTLRRPGSRLPGHPDVSRRTPGIEMSSGSLGQGVSFGIGVAQAARIRGLDHRTFVLVGDGECNEGQVWEAALLAPHWGLDRLTVVVDRNDAAVEGPRGPISPLGDLAAKWRSFGWAVEQIDGHRMPEVQEALRSAGTRRDGKPTAIIATTRKGHGLSIIEQSPTYHADPLPDEALRQAIATLSPTGSSYLDVP